MQRYKLSHVVEVVGKSSVSQCRCLPLTADMLQVVCSCSVKLSKRPLNLYPLIIMVFFAVFSKLCGYVISGLQKTVEKQTQIFPGR